MDLLKLKYFMAIAKNRNLTRASQELYISQPTLSKFLQKLEQELGGKLFRRNGNNYDLTFLGQRYLEYAQKFLNLNQDWEKELLDMRSSYKGELNIALPPMRSVCLCPPILSRFHELHPGVNINIYEHDHSIQEILLENSKLDFAILNYWKILTGLTYEELSTEELLLVLPQGHPLGASAIKKEGCKYPWIDLHLLKDSPFILQFRDQNTGLSAQQLFEQSHISPPVHFRTRNNILALQMVSSGMGVCFSPEMYVQYISQMLPLQFFSVGEPHITNKLIIAHRQNAYLTTYAQDFIRIAKEALAPLEP